MESSDKQQLLFQHIKGRLPVNVSFVEEIAEVLNISNDSAYRRIRGEKPITLEETKKLCIRYEISIDQLLHLNSESLIFTGKFADPKNFNLELYLKDFLHQYEIFNSFGQKELLILAKEIPVYHIYNFPELAGFKYFFWMKTILHYPQYNRSLFNPSEMVENFTKIREKILVTANKISSTEIWNVDILNTTLRQVEYYKESNEFASLDDMLKIYDCLERTIDHVEAEAEAGYKINQLGKGPHEGAPFNLYINDFLIPDNTYMPILNGRKIVFLTHTHLNYIITKDVAFAESTYEYLQNILHKSAFISVVGEKERRAFFNKIRKGINESKKKVLR